MVTGCIDHYVMLIPQKCMLGGGGGGGGTNEKLNKLKFIEP